MTGKWEVKKGEFIRATSSFRNWITKDGNAGPTGDGDFAAEPDRYHLYISHACPWAHRTMIFRALKELEDKDYKKMRKLLTSSLSNCN